MVNTRDIKCRKLGLTGSSQFCKVNQHNKLLFFEYTYILSVPLKLKFSYTDMVSVKSFYSSQINFHTSKSQTLTETWEMKSSPKLSSLQDKQSANLHHWITHFHCCWNNIASFIHTQLHKLFWFICALQWTMYEVLEEALDYVKWDFSLCYQIFCSSFLANWI